MLACSAGEETPPLPRSGQGPAGLSDAEWGALLFREHGCTGCHSLDASAAPAGSLRSVVQENAPEGQAQPEGDEETPDDAPVPQDESWAQELLLRPSHGEGESRVSLALSPDEARALSAFLATTR